MQLLTLNFHALFFRLIASQPANPNLDLVNPSGVATAVDSSSTAPPVYGPCGPLIQPSP